MCHFPHDSMVVEKHCLAQSLIFRLVPLLIVAWLCAFAFAEDLNQAVKPALPEINQQPSPEITVQASSELKSEDGMYAANNLLENTYQSWCEGAVGDGKGESISFEFASPREINGFFIRNGVGLEKYWKLNNRIKTVLINNKTYQIQDCPDPQWIKLESSIKVKKLQMKIGDVYKGDKWQDTCIAEISFDRTKPFIESPAAIIAKLNGFGESRRYGYDGFPLRSQQYHDFGCIARFKSDGSYECDLIPCGGPGCPMTDSGSCLLIPKFTKGKKPYLECDMSGHKFKLPLPGTLLFDVFYGEGFSPGHRDIGIENIYRINNWLENLQLDGSFNCDLQIEKTWLSNDYDMITIYGHCAFDEAPDDATEIKCEIIKKCSHEKGNEKACTPYGKVFFLQRGK